MRALLPSIMTIALATGSAAADTDLVVLGPAAIGNVSARHLGQVQALLDHPAARALDAPCAADPRCLVTAGTELGAQRVLAITVAETRGALAIGITLVDVVGNERVATRDLAIAERKLAKELGPAITKFLDEAPTERAKALFAEGNQHFNLGELDQALELYKRAYRIKPLPAFLFNIAQCHRKLGHFQDAITMYQSYLVGVPNAQDKPLVDSLIVESKAAIAEQQQREQRAAALAAKVEADRQATERSRLEEQRKAREAEAVAAVERRKAEQARFAHERETYDRHPARKWMIATGILGAAALGTGAYFGVKARDAQASFDAQGCGDPMLALAAGQLAACRSERDAGQKDASRANAFMVGGGAVLAVSLLVFAIDPGNVGRPETPRAALHLAPTSIQLAVSW